MSRPWTEHSKSEWSTTGARDEDPPSDFRLQIGCLQRIATAVEVMSGNHAKLIEERDRYKKWYTEQYEATRACEKKIASLKGVITKMKRKALIP